MKSNDAYSRLVEHGVKPSVQRLAIMDYLLTHFTHPTVDDIYKALHPIIPTLSKTTVYNTLRLFADHHVAQVISVDDHHICYDGDMSPHTHFYCNQCGRIHDLQLTTTPQADQRFLQEGHLVDMVQVYYRGICKECRKQGKTN